MNGIEIPFQGETLCALGSGALYWAARDLLIVSDLHFGKSERIAPPRGTMLPPYAPRATPERPDADLPATRRIISYENGEVVVKSLTFENHRML